jgi:hypothetical protein
MRYISTLLTMLLILASVNTATAMLVEVAGEISYQVPRADRIVAGTVTDVKTFYDHIIIAIEVDEWLRIPLPVKTITVRTECGTGVWTEDEASFATNETAILMLEDMDASENRFRLVCGEVGKRPISDRNTILKEISNLSQRSGDSDDEIMRNPPPNPVEFIMHATDHGLDMDRDGLFDYLIVEINARTDEPGRYSLTGELCVPLGTHEMQGVNGKIGTGFHIIELAPAAVHLNESVQTVAINFEGGSIRNDQINGPYEVSISVNNETYGFGRAFDHTTGDYEYAQFEQPDMLLSGPVRSKADATELAREKAEELDIVVGEVNHTRIRIDHNHEIWFIEFKGGEFDEVFMIYGKDDIRHWTMDDRRPKGVYVPFIGVAGVIAIVALVCALCSRKWRGHT